MTEMERMKSMLLGSWDVLTYPAGVWAHYTFDATLEYFRGNAPTGTIEGSTTSPYHIRATGNSFFIVKSDEIIEIGAIGANWMVWVKGGKQYLLKRIA